jgi:hypothetical protein
MSTKRLASPAPGRTKAGEIPAEGRAPYSVTGGTP